MISRTDAERADHFWTRVSPEPNTGCWLWDGKPNPGGYGQFAWFASASEPAHRVAYTLAVGEIPRGLAIDHLCCNRSCVNPQHLEAVTTAENSRRMWKRARR